MRITHEWIPCDDEKEITLVTKRHLQIQFYEWNLNLYYLMIFYLNLNLINVKSISIKNNRLKKYKRRQVKWGINYSQYISTG